MERQIERVDRNGHDDSCQKQTEKRENNRHDPCAFRLRRDVPETHREGGNEREVDGFSKRELVEARYENAGQGDDQCEGSERPAELVQECEMSGQEIPNPRWSPSATW